MIDGISVLFPNTLGWAESAVKLMVPTGGDISYESECWLDIPVKIGEPAQWEVRSQVATFRGILWPGEQTGRCANTNPEVLPQSAGALGVSAAQPDREGARHKPVQ